MNKTSGLRLAGALVGMWLAIGAGTPPATAQQPPHLDGWPSAFQVLPLPPVDDPEVVDNPEEVEAVPEVEVDESPEEVKMGLVESSFEFGIDGSSGNSQTFNLHTGYESKYVSALGDSTLEIDYWKDSQDDVQTQNRLFFDGRHEVCLDESRWTPFVHSTLEFDDLLPFDSRLTADAGMGYKFVDTKKTTLLGRFGAGASHEIGGPDNRWVPEGAFGGNFKHKLTKRQSIGLTVDYFPDWGDFGDYRVTNQARWSILLDKAGHLSLKVGVINRYDSTPNGAKPNDLDYSTTLLWHY